MYDYWEANARAYASLINNRGTPHHRHILNPCVERLLGDVRGKRLLDAGCGEGYLSRYYARRGAVVTGIDVSGEMIQIGKERAVVEGLDIDHRVGDICDLRGVPDDHFDLVLCNLVLLNIPCLDAAVQELARVLRGHGVLVASVVHPAFNLYGPGRWEVGEKDYKTGRRRGLFFRMDNYFDEKGYERYWRTRAGEQFPRPIVFFHRTVSTYFSAFRSSGLIVTDIEEPVPDTDDEFFERERRVPVFMVFRACKGTGVA